MRAWFTERFRRIRTSTWLRDSSERALWQALQGALAALALATGLENVPWQLLASYAIGGALASLLASFIALPPPESRGLWQTVLYRVLRTAVAAVAGLLAAVTTVDGAVDVFAVDWSSALKLLGYTVVIALVKNSVQLGQPERAPPEPD